MLEAAYDDSQGVTAEFNLNMLRVVNRELDADFDLGQFEHVAFYDEAREWIEMRLRARRAHRCAWRRSTSTSTSTAARSCGPRSRPSSRPARVRTDLAAAGLELVEWLTDPEELFALSLSRRAPGAAPPA